MRSILVLGFFFVLFALPVSAACAFTVAAKSTQAFIAEIPSIDSRLGSCPVPLDSASRRLFADENVQLTISMTDGSVASILFTISGGTLTGAAIGADTHGWELRTDECALTAILSSDNRYGAFAHAYLSSKFGVQPKGLWNGIKYRLAKIFVIGKLRAAQVDTDLGCDKPNGELCAHGGECASGNCVGEGSGPPWTYRCSCDPMTYRTVCAAVAAPVVGASGKLAVGQACKHGGECETGNCVGVGAGPPWTYQCSCDPFRFATGC